MAVALRELLAKFGFEVDTAALDRADAAIARTSARVQEMGREAQAAGPKVQKGLKLADLGRGLQALGLAAAATAAVRSVVSLAHGIEQMGSELQDTSAQTGLSIRALQEWRFIAGQSGASADGVTRSLGFFQRAVFAASRGGKGQASVFRQLGVSVTDASGRLRPTSDLMMEAGLAIAGLGDDAARTAYATKIFGREGLTLLPLFAQGEAGVAKLREQFNALGGGMSGEASAAADEYGDAIGRFDLALTSVKGTVATALLPTLTRFQDWLSKGVGWFTRLAKGSRVAEIGMVALSAAAVVAAASFAAAWFSALWPVALAALLVGIFALEVEDLITYLEGGDSAIGRFIDSIFGVGAAKKHLELLKGGFHIVANAARVAAAVITTAFGAVAAVVKAVNSQVASAVGAVRGAATFLGIGAPGAPGTTPGAGPQSTRSVATVPSSASRVVSQQTSATINVSSSAPAEAIATIVMRRLSEVQAAAQRAAMVAAGGESD